MDNRIVYLGQNEMIHVTGGIPWKPIWDKAKGPLTDWLVNTALKELDDAWECFIGSFEG